MESILFDSHERVPSLRTGDKDGRTLWLWGGMHKQRKAQITRNKFRRRHRWRGDALENFNWRNAAGEIKPTSEGSGKKVFGKESAKTVVGSGLTLLQ